MSVKFSNTESSLVISRSFLTWGTGAREAWSGPPSLRVGHGPDQCAQPRAVEEIDAPHVHEEVDLSLLQKTDDGSFSKRDSDSPMTRSPSTVRIVTWPSSVVVSCMKAGEIMSKSPPQVHAPAGDTVGRRHSRPARPSPTFSRGEEAEECLSPPHPLLLPVADAPKPLWRRRGFGGRCLSRGEREKSGDREELGPEPEIPERGPGPGDPRGAR